MMDLVQLRSFAEVAERGTVAAAASALGYTAPAVSQHLAKLESELATTLFDRATRRLRLTESGHRLLPVAMQMIDLDTLARTVVQERPDRLHVRVAGLASAISTMVVPRLDMLQPQFVLEIVEAEDADALRDLSLGVVDLVLTQEYQGMAGTRDPRLRYSALTSDQLKLVLPPRMAASTTIGELGDARWIINGTDTRCSRATHQILASHGLSPIISGNVADNRTLLDLVAAGHGVTIVPELVLHSANAQVVVAEQELSTTRSILAVTREVMSVTMQPLLDALCADAA